MTAVRRAITIGLTLTYGLTAVAAASAAPDRGKKKDPNEVVCERQEVLGTRLSMKRVCKTRAEWVENRRLEREHIEKIQVGGPCVKDAGC